MFTPALPYIEAYGNREAEFNYRGHGYVFSLSHGLFSSAGIDTGSRFLLKVFSNYLDFSINAPFPGRPFFNEDPFMVLDSGCGAGVLGICAARALFELAGKDPDSLAIHVRAQDRDELARIFSLYNAERNGLSTDVFSAHTEPLLSGPPDSKWDLILCNIPAKTGQPVLEDFIGRSVRLLKSNGRVFLVVVKPLASFFSSCIKSSALLLSEDATKDHTVFVYGAAAETQGGEAPNPVILEENFPNGFPFYIRNDSEYEMADIVYRLKTLHGAPDFDCPGGAEEAAAKLATKIDLKAQNFNNGSENTLIHCSGQGHFALWLNNYFGRENAAIVLSGRNFLSLSAARAGLLDAQQDIPERKREITIVPAADIFLDRERILAAPHGAGKGYGLITFFPETVPETSREDASWKGIDYLSMPGTIFIAGMSSSEAERFDREKTSGWQKIGDIRKNGFRAIAYQKQ